MYRTCRICDRHGDAEFSTYDMVRYGKRHYAHVRCWVKVRDIRDLNKYQRRQVFKYLNNEAEFKLWALGR